MASEHRIQELAQTIAKNVLAVQDALSKHGLSSPSFAPGGTIAFPLEVTNERSAVIDAAQELHDLMLDPMTLLAKKAAHNQMAPMKAINKWKIANAFEPTESISFEELSKRCGLEEQPLRHILRHGMLLRIFAEHEKGFVSHTPASILIRDSVVQDWLEGGVDILWPSSVRLVDALQKWPGSEEPQHTGFSLAHGTELSLYEKLGSDNEFAQKFGNSMTAMVENNPVFDNKHLHGAYDWEGFGEKLLVDVGGSHGRTAISLAQKFPLKVIVQDFESTIQSAPSNLPEAIKDRVTFEAHNFFEPQTTKADAYLFRWVFHNHSDKYSARILQALIPVLNKDTKIFIFDGCLPEPNRVPKHVEQDIRNMDLLMNTYFKSWERDAGEWAALLAKADKHFELVNVTQPLGSALALLEVKWNA